MPKKTAPAKPKRGEQISGNAVIYARYSSHNQKDISIEQQVEKDRAKADELGIEVTGVYADRAISGRSDKRPEFQRLMRDARKGMFQYVIAWKSSRIGRNMLEAMVNESKLLELNVRIIYVEEDFDDTAAGRFAARSMMNVNQFYSENMAEDIRRGLSSNAARCMVNGKLPLGYKADAELHYQVDEDEAAIVREIFDRVSRQEPFADIAEDLNARGLRTKTGKEWGRSSFASILSNERYRGVYIYGSTRIEGGIPRIVSDETYYSAQDALRIKTSVTGRKRKNMTYLLTGKVFCGECGSYMTGVSGTSRNGEAYYYYACTKRRNEKGCTKQHVTKDDAERRVTLAIKQFILRPEVETWIADSVEEFQKSAENNPELTLLNEQLKEVNSGIGNLMKAIEQGIITPTTKARLQELEGEQGRLLAKISLEQANRFDVSRDEVIAWLRSYRDGDIESPEFQAELINTFLVAVYFFDNDSKIRLVFSMEGTKHQIEFKDDKIVSVDGAAPVRISSAKLHQCGAMRTIILDMYSNGLFVLTAQ